MIPYKLLYISALLMLVGGIFMIFSGRIPVGLLFVATAVLFIITGVNNQKNQNNSKDESNIDSDTHIKNKNK